MDASLAWALGAVVAVAIIVGVAVLLTRPDPVSAPGSSASPSPASSSAAQGRRPSTIEEGTWWRVGWAAPEPGDFVEPTELAIGTLAGGITARLPFPMQASGPPYVRGPVAGQVLVVTAAERATQLQLVDAATGRIRLIGEVSPPAIDAALTPDAGAVVYLAEADGGLAAYALPADGTGVVRRLTSIEPRVAAVQGIVLAARILPRAELLLSPEADRLAILDCFETCRLRVVVIDTGEQISLDLEMVEGLQRWSGDEIALGMERCLDLSLLRVLEQACAGMPQEPPLRYFLAGVELPAGWHPTIRPDATNPGAGSRAVAIGPHGEVVVLDRLGVWGGSGG